MPYIGRSSRLCVRMKGSMKRHNFDEILSRIDALEPSDVPHDKKAVELQGYTIKAVVALIDVTEKLMGQNEKLETTNVSLQKRLLLLTVVMGVLAVLTFFFDILDFLRPPAF